MGKGRRQAERRGFAPRRKARLERMFRCWDLDQDGFIVPDEFKGREGAFDRLDRNQDGKLGRKELSKRFGTERAKRRNAGPPRPRKERPESGGPSEPEDR